MAIRDTSIDAYHAIYCTGRAQTTALKILNAMQPGKHYTIAQLETLTGMRANSVSGRLKDLKDRGFVLEASTRMKCPITGASVTPVFRPQAVQAQKPSAAAA